MPKRRVEICLEFACGGEAEVETELVAVTEVLEPLRLRYPQASIRIVSPRPRTRPRAPAPTDVLTASDILGLGWGRPIHGR